MKLYSSPVSPFAARVRLSTYRKGRRTEKLGAYAQKTDVTKYEFNKGYCQFNLI